MGPPTSMGLPRPSITRPRRLLPTRTEAFRPSDWIWQPGLSPCIPSSGIRRTLPCLNPTTSAWTVSSGPEWMVQTSPMETAGP
jgi:hypothetical protein